MLRPISWGDAGLFAGRALLEVATSPPSGRELSQVEE
jgi:hypothetical protein